jgi:hypothetical protein
VTAWPRASWRELAWGEPTVISPLRVVEGSKLRLCINPMYINLFIAYKRVHYEGLQDLTHMLDQGSYMVTLDDKSGEARRGSRTETRLKVCVAHESNAKTARFFSLHGSLTAEGVDALAQDWAGVTVPGAAGSPLLYAFPPWCLVGAVLAKARRERADLLLLAPAWPRWWKALKAGLPIRGQALVADGCITAGPRVPKGALPVRYAVEVLYIRH